MYNERLMKNERPIFPKRAVITAGMPYGNKNLHFGHVGGMFVHADIFARFLRDRIGKDNVIFVSGTDCCASDKAYADECSLGHQFMPSELINPISSLSGKKPVLKDVENWYFDLDKCIDRMKEYNDFLRKTTNTRKYQLETVEEFLQGFVCQWYIFPILLQIVICYIWIQRPVAVQI